MRLLPSEILEFRLSNLKQLNSWKLIQHRYLDHWKDNRYTYFSKKLSSGFGPQLSYGKLKLRAYSTTIPCFPLNWFLTKKDHQMLLNISNSEPWLLVRRLLTSITNDVILNCFGFKYGCKLIFFLCVHIIFN